MSYGVMREFILDALQHNDFPNDKELIAAMQKAVNRSAVAARNKKPGRLVIDEDKKIYLPDYSNKELQLQHLPASVFLFFLFKTDGIELHRLKKDVGLLNKIYSIVVENRNVDALRAKKSIINLTDPSNNRIYETCAMVKRALSGVVPGTVINQYCITGERGKKHGVLLDRNLIEVRCNKLKGLINW